MVLAKKRSTAVWQIRIRGIRILSLEPDPYKKMAGSGILIRIHIK